MENAVNIIKQQDFYKDILNNFIEKGLSLYSKNELKSFKKTYELTKDLYGLDIETYHDMKMFYIFLHDKTDVLTVKNDVNLFYLLYSKKFVVKKLTDLKKMLSHYYRYYQQNHAKIVSKDTKEWWSYWGQKNHPVTEKLINITTKHEEKQEGIFITDLNKLFEDKKYYRFILDKLPEEYSEHFFEKEISLLKEKVLDKDDLEETTKNVLRYFFENHACLKPFKFNGVLYVDHFNKKEVFLNCNEKISQKIIDNKEQEDYLKKIEEIAFKKYSKLLKRIKINQNLEKVDYVTVKEDNDSLFEYYYYNTIIGFKIL